MTLKRTLAGLGLSATLAIGSVLTPVASAQAGSERGNFMVRVLGTAVVPDSAVSVGGANIGEIGNSFVPATTLTYFFAPSMSVELLCCFAKHTASLNGGPDIGSTWIFPPTLTLQYHFDGLGALKPYIGAGVTWIHFFKEEALGPFAGQSFKIDDAFGVALQAGVDVSMGGGWYLNADVKKIFLSTDARYSGGLVAQVDLDPWIISAGVGYRFNLDSLFHRDRSVEPLK